MKYFSAWQFTFGYILRVWQLLIVERLSYVKCLKREYPYLFSLAVRTNPFDAPVSVRLFNDHYFAGQRFGIDSFLRG